MFSQVVVNHILVEEAEFDLAIDRATADYLSSSKEEDNKEWGGSRKGKVANKERGSAEAYERVTKGYFSGPGSSEEMKSDWSKPGPKDPSCRALGRFVLAHSAQVLYANHS